VLYGGYDAERDRLYWKEFTFHHYLGECGLPGPFLGAPVASGRQPSMNLSSRRLEESSTKRMSSF
jgi:hypothetical protein